MLIRNKYSVLPCRYDKILCAKRHNRDGQFVNHMRIHAFLTHNDIANALFFHFLRQRVPCSNVLPRTVIGNHSKRIRFLDNLVVEAVLFQLRIMFHNRRKIPVLHIFISNAHQVFQLESKDARVPERPLVYQFLRRSLIRLFLKSGYFPFCSL